MAFHLLNLLAVFFIALIVYFNEFEKPDQDRSRTIKGLVITGLVASVAFGLVYPGVIQILPDVAGKSGAPLLFVSAIVGLLIFLHLLYTEEKAACAQYHRRLPCNGAHRLLNLCADIYS